MVKTTVAIILEIEKQGKKVKALTLPKEWFDRLRHELDGDTHITSPFMFRGVLIFESPLQFVLIEFEGET